jgi:hypothetical protein
MTNTTDLPLQSRVRLRPAHNWLSKYAPLAEAGRLGTVLGRPDPHRAFVKFDTVRRGAMPICASFLIVDLIVVAGAQPADAQAELLA